MQVQPYLFFDGRCDEALEFYKTAVGAKVDMLMRFKDAPDQSMISPGSYDKVMHAAVHVGDTQLLMSDGRCLGKPNFQGFALTITASDAAEDLAARLAELYPPGGPQSWLRTPPVAETPAMFKGRHPRTKLIQSLLARPLALNPGDRCDGARRREQRGDGLLPQLLPRYLYPFFCGPGGDPIQHVHRQRAERGHMAHEGRHLRRRLEDDAKRLQRIDFSHVVLQHRTQQLELKEGISRCEVERLKA